MGMGHFPHLTTSALHTLPVPPSPLGALIAQRKPLFRVALSGVAAYLAAVR